MRALNLISSHIDDGGCLPPPPFFSYMLYSDTMPVDPWIGNTWMSSGCPCSPLPALLQADFVFFLLHHSSPEIAGSRIRAITQLLVCQFLDLHSGLAGNHNPGIVRLRRNLPIQGIGMGPPKWLALVHEHWLINWQYTWIKCVHKGIQ